MKKLIILVILATLQAQAGFEESLENIMRIKAQLQSIMKQARSTGAITQLARGQIVSLRQQLDREIDSILDNQTTALIDKIILLNNLQSNPDSSGQVEKLMKAMVRVIQYAEDLRESDPRAFAVEVCIAYRKRQMDLNEALQQLRIQFIQRVALTERLGQQDQQAARTAGTGQ